MRLFAAAALASGVAATMNRTLVAEFLETTNTISVPAEPAGGQPTDLTLTCQQCRAFVHDGYFTVYLAARSDAAPSVGVEVHACDGDTVVCALSVAHMRASAAVLKAVERSVDVFGEKNRPLFELSSATESPPTTGEL